MKDTVVIALLLVACSFRADAGPVVNSEADTSVKIDTTIDSSSGNGLVETQIESPENVDSSYPEIESRTMDEVVINTDPRSVHNSLFESEEESQIDPVKVESCLADISKNLTNLEVPSQVEKLASYIRSLNPNLPGQYLTDLIVDKRASLDVHKAGYIRDDEKKLYEQECWKFVEKFLEIVGSSECDNNFMNIINPHEEKNYRSIMEKHDDVDKMVGYTEACFTL